MPEYNEENNVYATDVKGNTLHISEANSGRKGYFCLGCERELQAVISKRENRISYFRHDPKAVKNQKKCTYSDETYRHKLAKEILQRIKKIKIPAVYKYPPIGESGFANLLIEPTFIEAHTVGIEKAFYEDESGEIHYGSNPGVNERFLLVRPDVTFFDINLKPILFIEIVVTHGVNSDKLIKLKRLGIDTIQIKIPKESPEAIEKSFYNTSKIKWIYNNVEESTEYLPISDSGSEGVSSIDELQRKLFEESFSCRSAQVKSLIRTLNRCLESKPHREIEQRNREELSRVTKNTEERRGRQLDLQEELRKRVFSRFEGDYREIAERRKCLITEEDDFQKYVIGMERRYNSKTEELAGEERVFNTRVKKTIEDLGREGQSFEESKKEIEHEERGIEGNIEDERARIGEIEARRRGLSGRFERLKKSAIDRNEQFKEETRSRFESLSDAERRRVEEIRRERENLPEKHRAEEIRLSDEFEKLREQSTTTIMSRDDKGDSELSRRIRAVLHARGQLEYFQSSYATLKRIRSAWGCFRSGAYKNWKE